MLLHHGFESVRTSGCLGVIECFLGIRHDMISLGSRVSVWKWAVTSSGSSVPAWRPDITSTGSRLVLVWVLELKSLGWRALIRGNIFRTKCSDLETQSHINRVKTSSGLGIRGDTLEKSVPVWRPEVTSLGWRVLVRGSEVTSPWPSVPVWRPEVTSLGWRVLVQISEVTSFGLSVPLWVWEVTSLGSRVPDRISEVTSSRLSVPLWGSEVTSSGSGVPVWGSEVTWQGYVFRKHLLWFLKVL